MTADGWVRRGAGGEDGGGARGRVGGEQQHRDPALGTYQLHSRQHLQEGDEVVAISQVFVEVIDVLAHLQRAGEEKPSDSLAAPPAFSRWLQEHSRKAVASASRRLPPSRVHLKWLFQNHR